MGLDENRIKDNPPNVIPKSDMFAIFPFQTTFFFKMADNKNVKRKEGLREMLFNCKSK